MSVQEKFDACDHEWGAPVRGPLWREDGLPGIGVINEGQELPWISEESCPKCGVTQRLTQIGYCYHVTPAPKEGEE